MKLNKLKLRVIREDLSLQPIFGIWPAAFGWLLSPDRPGSAQ